jgi:membrane-associated phospholipid phosphatase
MRRSSSKHSRRSSPKQVPERPAERSAEHPVERSVERRPGIRFQSLPELTPEFIQSVIHEKLPETAWQTVRRLQRQLSTSDLCTLFMLVFYTVLNVRYFAHVEHAFTNIVVNFSLCVGLMGLALADSYAPSVPVTILRKFFLLPGIFFIYAQAHIYIHLVNPVDVDNMLIALDYRIFGVHPTQWLYRFTHPWLTEWLQICYILYFFIPIALGVEVYLRKDYDDFMDYTAILAFSFYLSYLLYFFAPAIGPCFTLHSFSTLAIELPGVWATEFIRHVVNGGSGIPPTSVNPAFNAHRNCMPSGHTMLTVMNVIMAYRLRSRLRGTFLFIGISIVISTVYLRYHYVVDVVAGTLAALAALWVLPRIQALLRRGGFLKA